MDNFLTRTVLLETPRFEVVRDTIKTSNGSRDQFYIRKADAVLVVLLRGDTIGLLSVRRHLIDGVGYEVPGGRIEPGENAENAARREILEEVGASCDNLRQLAVVHPLPSVCTERVHIFAASVSPSFSPTIGVEAADEEGILSVDFLSFDEVRRLIQYSRITCAVDALALMLIVSAVP